MRTSENSWCLDADCGADPVVRALSQRIAAITQADPRAFELYQVRRAARAVVGDGGAPHLVPLRAHAARSRLCMRQGCLR